MGLEVNLAPNRARNRISFKDRPGTLDPAYNRKPKLTLFEHVPVSLARASFLSSEPARASVSGSRVSLLLASSGGGARLGKTVWPKARRKNRWLRAAIEAKPLGSRAEPPADF
eukprot:1365975-Pyramimonas_sp.AAC.1